MSGITKGALIITGAGSGLGRGILLEFVRSGCTSILASDIDSEGLAETIKQAKKLDPTVKIVSMIVDVTNEEQVNQMVALAVKNFGRIEYSIHSAGVSDLSLGRLDDSTLEGHCRVLDVNLKGVLLCERAVLGVMKTQELRILENGTTSRGTIVNISSILGQVALNGASTYVVSKHAINGLTKADALDYAPDKIRINAVAPAFVRTKIITEQQWEAVENGPVLKKHALGRLGLVEEVADAVVFLASDKASFITGISLPVDGGYSLH